MPRVKATEPTIARLADLVRESGLTKVDVAERAGMRPEALHRILTGKVDPSVSRVDRIRRAIGCDWADLDPPAGGSGGTCSEEVRSTPEQLSRIIVDRSETVFIDSKGNPVGPDACRACWGEGRTPMKPVSSRLREVGTEVCQSCNGTGKSDFREIC
jgi:transcriptional regulator with XRE-family HTH domain